MLIQGLGTATPQSSLRQDDLAHFAGMRNAANDRQRRLLARLYEQTTITTRSSVLADAALADDLDARTLHQKGNDPEHAHASRGFHHFYRPVVNHDNHKGPSTRQRLAIYEQKALPLAVDATKQALSDAAIDASQITHIVIVTCTGFAAPGLEVRLISELGMRPDTPRTAIGFMGCHGAVNGMRTAHAITHADPAQVVLVCCVELCTLHYQYGWNEQTIVANSLFSDGAAAVIVTHESKDTDTAPTTKRRGPKVDAFHTTIVPESEDAMTWRMGDHGFQMTLSPSVPALIHSHLPDFLTRWLDRNGLAVADIGGWAIHPGGPRVIRSVVQALQLPDQASTLSHQVLRDHGNMSSPTLLFILQSLMQENLPRPWVAMAFGPGLVIEAMLIR